MERLTARQQLMLMALLGDDMYEKVYESHCKWKLSFAESIELVYHETYRSKPATKLPNVTGLYSHK